MTRTGILLVNLGSPDAPTKEAVGPYLRQFLMDEKVIDIPAPLRWMLVNLVIVPRRSGHSAKLYQSIWTGEGSPLIVHTKRLADRLRESIGGGLPVEIGMRYGNPSVESGLASLLASGAERILCIPLYPQYAESSYETAAIAVRDAARRLGLLDRIELIPPFHDREEYLGASAVILRESLDTTRPEHVLFSYHSLPVRHIERLDATGSHCLRRDDCCGKLSSVNAKCYRAHCLATTREIAARAGIATDGYSIGFQSRLGRAKWLGPQTEDLLRELAGRGVRSVAVTCPSFVADCLETLEEIGERGRKSFLEAGGEMFHLVPALNSHPVWVDALRSIIASRY